MKKSYLLHSDKLVDQETQRLEVQAEIFWRREEPLFKSLVDDDAECLIDFGCGNGAYMALAAQYFERSVGFDIHPKLLQHAKERLPDSEFVNVGNLSRKQLTALISDIRPSVILMRFVVQHFTEDEWGILKLLAEYTNANTSRLIIVDCDDNGNTFTPSDPVVEDAFDSLSSYIQAKGGNRKPNKLLADAFANWGLPSLEQFKVPLVFTKENFAEFESTLLPGLVTANTSVSRGTFEDYFNSGGEIVVPIYYHASPRSK